MWKPKIQFEETKINLTLQSDLATPMIVLVFKGPIFAVVDPEEWTSNIQVGPYHLYEITSGVYTHDVFDLLGYSIMSAIKVTSWFSNIKMLIWEHIKFDIFPNNNFQYARLQLHYDKTNITQLHDEDENCTKTKTHTERNKQRNK